MRPKVCVSCADSKPAATQDFPQQSAAASQSSSQPVDLPALAPAFSGSTATSVESSIPSGSAVVPESVQIDEPPKPSPAIPTISAPDEADEDHVELPGSCSPPGESAGGQGLNSVWGAGAAGEKNSVEAVKPQGIWAFITGADKASTTPSAR